MGTLNWVAIENLKHFKSKIQIAGEIDSESSKSLNITTFITSYDEVVSLCTVEKDEVQIFKSESLTEAIGKYNEL